MMKVYSVRLNLEGTSLYYIIHVFGVGLSQAVAIV